MAHVNTIDQATDISQLLADLLPSFEAAARAKADFHKSAGLEELRQSYRLLELELFILRSNHAENLITPVAWISSVEEWLLQTESILALFDNMLDPYTRTESTINLAYPRLRAIQQGTVSCDALLLMPAANGDILKHIDDCGRAMDRICRIEVRVEVTEIAPPLPRRDIRHCAKQLHDSLSNYWKCRCSLRHEGMLYLSAHDPENALYDVKFDFLFGTHSTTMKWQETEFCIICPQRQPSAPLPTIRLNADAPSAENMQRRGVAIESVCSAAPINNNVSLNLIVEDKVIRKNIRNRRKSSARNVGKAVSLRQILKDSLLRKSYIAQILAVVLANSALQLCGTPWLRRDWSADDVYFLETRDNKTILRPALLAHFQDVHLDVTNNTDDEDSLHPNRAILALGILLLELFFKKPIEMYRTGDDLTDEGKVDANTDYFAASRACEEEDWDVHEQYQKAVRCCLGWNRESEDDEFGSADSHDYLYKNVIWQLEDELRKYKFAVSSLDELLLQPLAETTTFSQRAPQSEARTEGIQLNEPIASELRSHPQLLSETVEGLQQHTNHSATTIFLAPTNTYEDTPFSFFDDKVPRAGAAALADQWFRLFRQNVRPFIPRESKPKDRVKIAILDTGIDMEETVIASHRERIIKVESFLTEDDSTDDLDGHGTHAAALILRVAANADLFVARIAKTQKLLHKASIIKALEEAIKWEADIISMSFGFTAFNEDLRGIQDVIQAAYSKNILMFCAASNNGGNGGIAYPADRDEVICINSANGEGSVSGFNPGEPRPGYNFCTLGEDVNSSWPSRFALGDQRKSGTSFATPIAAGIAAVVLNYCRYHHVPERHAFKVWKLKTRQGMKSVFELMSWARSGYLWLDPGKIFNVSDSDILGSIFKALN